MTLRPYAVVIDGRLETGLEVEIDEAGTIAGVQAGSGKPEDYVLSAAFVNAHSHLEYRGLLGKIQLGGYPEFIRSITQHKEAQSPASVREDCLLAATENRQTGVAMLGEHSDRPFSGSSMSVHGLDGTIFQEVITFNQASSPEDKLEKTAESLRENARHFDGEVVLSPHAPWTVDQVTLQALAEAGGHLSIHVAESVAENEYFMSDKGFIADMCRAAGVRHEHGERAVTYLGRLGYLRPGVQFVHLCDLTLEDVELIAGTGVTVAHSPRSNEALACPRTPVREMLDAGLAVGLGMDSAASSGPIDMFAEMRSALKVAADRGRELTAEEVWRMATSMGAQSLWIDGWDVQDGANMPLIKLHVPGVETTQDLIELAGPRSVEWVNPTVRS
jgi:5-methylthioadenosine/S-adenosylhomocysteine deaminase